MYTDTHFHFSYFSQNGEDFGTGILETMAKDSAFLGLDVGTKCDDLLSRRDFISDCIEAISDSNTKHKCERMIRFSAGIWPDVESIKNRESCMETLREQIEEFKEEGDVFSNHLVAIGEAGLDHHWNPSGADGRSEDDFDTAVYEGERELFAMQLELARELDLTFIVHSRDAFDDTLDVIKNCGYNKGVIHCFSYGMEEARKFLDLGWYIAFGGGVTYTKKSRMDEMNELLRFVPDDRILLETDAPYLAPVPLRGTENSPVNVRYTYEFISQRRGVSIKKLCDIVDSNCRTLFNM